MNIFEIRDKCRANFNVYLREVFASIPTIDGAYMLDIGCGSGVSSREIALTTDYMITAMDIDDAALRHFRQAIAGTNAAKQINIIRGTFETAIALNMAFDIVLAEGLFNVIGFEIGLRQTCALLKQGGYLVLHDGQDMVDEKRTMMNSYGFDVVKAMEVNEAVWGELCCGCLQKGIADVDEAELLEAEKVQLAQIKANIRLFHDSPQSYRSVYYLLKNCGAQTSKL